MSIEDTLGDASSSIKDIMENLTAKKAENSSESLENYETLVFEEEDDTYDSHVSYLEEEKGMNINYGDPIIHITSDTDTTIYAGPNAEQMINQEPLYNEGS